MVGEGIAGLGIKKESKMVYSSVRHRGFLVFFLAAPSHLSQVPRFFAVFRVGSGCYSI